MKASSEPLTVCQSALTVTGQPPDSWYKDEGGKNNCIDIAVQVCPVFTYLVYVCLLMSEGQLRMKYTVPP